MNTFLSPHHRKMLEEESRITMDVIQARGYRTITEPSVLQSLGFSDHQRRVPTLLIPVHNTRGEVALHHHRPDQPRLSKEKVVKYEFPTGAGMVVDVPPSVRAQVRDASVDLYITEGVKKADCAVSHGLCAIALLGVWNWRGTNESGSKTALPDWEDIALKDANSKSRTVYLCFDSDVMYKKPVHQALSRLAAFLKARGAHVLFVYLPQEAPDQKIGLDDYLAAGNTVESLQALATPTLRRLGGKQDPQDPETGTEDRGPSLVQRLVEIGHEAQLFHTDRGESFATFSVHTHRETWPVRSRIFRNWLVHRVRTEAGRVPSGTVLEDALRNIEASCCFDGPERELGIRVAMDGEGTVWYDLADRDWRAIRITPGHWEIVPNPPAIFRREAPAASQCVPEQGGGIERLRDFINLRHEDAWRQLVAWLVAALLPEIAHPILIVHGEQGSAKSTLMRLLVSLIDPSQIPLRSEPRDLDQWVQMADHAWLITLDNVSRLSVRLSDALCRAITGEGHSRRKLYTDNEDVILSFRRVIALTGIEIVAQREDVLDRSVLIPLDPITPMERRSEREVLEAFERERPRLFGALLDILAGVLRELPTVKPERLPRMADFARVGVAIERVLGWPKGAFWSAYHRNIASQHEEALAGSSVGEALLKHMTDGAHWEGTATELLRILTEQRQEVGLVPADWPKMPKDLSRQLRRLAPNLRAMGIESQFIASNGIRRIVLCRERR